MLELPTLVSNLDQLLLVDRFRDYAPNGLQVEGRSQVTRLATGVTACQALLEAAAAWSADAILVHHGYFWRNEDPCIRGMKRRRLATLLSHDMSLLAYHLPLDAHATLGNNSQLAAQLGLQSEGRWGDQDIAMVGSLAEPMAAADFAEHIAAVLGRQPLHIQAGPAVVRYVAWSSGGAQGGIEAAAALGVDAYVSGEISEPTTHVARECGLHYFAAGHHATERFGVQAIGEYLASTYGLAHRFFDIDNPA